MTSYWTKSSIIPLYCSCINIFAPACAILVIISCTQKPTLDAHDVVSSGASLNPSAGLHPQSCIAYASSKSSGESAQKHTHPKFLLLENVTSTEGHLF